jgi:hypothetical protein
MSDHEPSQPAAGIPLKAHVEELRSRCEAVSRLQGGSPYFHEELGIFRTYAEELGFFLAEPPGELSRPPDDEGNEHQIWCRNQTSSIISRVMSAGNEHQIWCRNQTLPSLIRIRDTAPITVPNQPRQR